ncbi:hypothetical protein GCM10011573_01960 [Enterococcus wangshanyuanii]|uniref:Uncharacterized protein n=1 Tax=Enterococcus wangshanyuanii TaxID=2005703 RepID=A0ABQ1NFX3_9ENTE|nr:hypothetical protein GCM10011573_01960 [Enterococcus wangshanyuanii]
MIDEYINGPSMSTVAWSFIYSHSFFKTDINKYLANKVSEVSSDPSNTYIVSQPNSTITIQEVK